MKLKKILKGLIIILPIIEITACSLHKSANKRSEIKDIVDMENNKSENIYSQEAMHFQLQQLQKNNIVYFYLDRYDIRSEFSEILDAHASLLRNNLSCKVTIEGHADERGTSEYNIALGERRANAVKIYLQSKGVSSDQISIVSYGKEKPAVLGHDEVSYSRNRRAVLIYSE